MNFTQKKQFLIFLIVIDAVVVFGASWWLIVYNPKEVDVGITEKNIPQERLKEEPLVSQRDIIEELIQKEQPEKKELSEKKEQFVQKKRHILFQYRNSRPKTVSIVGNFNRWDPKAHPMIKGKNNSWEVMIKLDPGEYFYKYVVDGRTIRDPNNPNFVDDGQGGKNSMLIVKPLSPPQRK
ncbi:MAG: isoamylase early set domain-containing protein [Elusimicrobiota bacterium]